MSCRFAFLLSLSGLLLAGLNVPALAQTVAVYVSDYHDHPLKGTILTTKGNSSTSAPTDSSGKTKIVLPSTIQPGDELALLLVSAPVQSMRIVSPWQGRAIVPKPTGFIEVVLGIPGDKQALQDPRVVSTWAEVIVKKNSEALAEIQPEKKRLGTLNTFSESAGFTPYEIDSAIRALANSGEKNEKTAMRMYLEEYPTALKIN